MEKIMYASNLVMHVTLKEVPLFSSLFQRTRKQRLKFNNLHSLRLKIIFITYNNIAPSFSSSFSKYYKSRFYIYLN